MTGTLSVGRATAQRALLAAAVTGDAETLGGLVTDDVTGWSPNLFVTSRQELLDELEEREGAFTNIAISVDTLDVIGGCATAEWRLSADHTGPMTLEVGDEDEVVIDPTGNTVVLAGATFADFDGDRICSLRHYFDDAALLEQLLGLI